AASAEHAGPAGGEVSDGGHLHSSLSRGSALQQAACAQGSTNLTVRRLARRSLVATLDAGGYLQMDERPSLGIVVQRDSRIDDAAVGALRGIERNHAVFGHHAA